ncbi:MAG: hypothetical protein KAJ51_07315, partial [Thermoplasmata archaeon]|nr:hypothetical protein [Thermoplasmata archaeon]
FDIYNYGERDLKGTITASHGFTTNRYEFFITPGKNVSFTITLNARDEGRYLGVAEIISNDEIAPRISIPIYIKITSHPFEGEDIIPEGLELEVEEEDEKEDLTILLCMIFALIIIFILIFIFSQSKKGKKKRPKAVKKGVKKLEKEKRPTTKKVGAKKASKEFKKVEQEKKPPIKKEEVSKVNGRKDVKKKDTISLKIPKFKGKKGLTGSLIIFGAIFCGFLIISSSFASSINILAIAQSNDSTNSNETKIYGQTPKDYMIWVPYYDINGNESECEMQAEFFDSDLKSFPPSWIEYGSTLSLKQLVEVPFSVEKLRFWMKYVDGGGPICIKLMKNVTGDQGASTEYFWVDYDSTSYGWCEVNISASKIAN